MSEPTRDSLIAVAMSGGVDSSTVAALLRRDGHRLVGLTMQLWNQRRLPAVEVEGATGRCCSLDDVYDARVVAARLGMPFYVVNFEDNFERSVVAPFVDAYLRGETPIPCTLCNNHVKFEQFLETARGVGADFMATGHYARRDFNADTGRYELRRGVDDSKDQTYFLFGLTQAQLERTLFPLGAMRKPDVRALAAELGVPTAQKNDSQEICFVPSGDYAAFIDAWFEEQGRPRPAVAGVIRDLNGKPLGEHQGVHHYTIGQRKGLHIAAREPLYVIQTDPVTQTVTVGSNDDLLSDHLTARDVNWVSIAGLSQPRLAQVKIRNKHEAAPATLTPGASPAHVEVRFHTPQRAITRGQAAVFYDGDLVLGGGWIE